MKRLLQKTMIAGMVCLFAQSVALADDHALITRYEQAKLRLSYEGNAGGLLQQLAHRLNIGFITYDVDISRKVSVQNNTETTIKAINEKLESQLPNSDIRFERLGSRLFLVVSAKNSEPLLANITNNDEQFVGDIIFDGNEITPEKASNTDTVAAVPDQNAIRLKHIYDTATNKANLAAAKSKKIPQYRVITKERLGLKNVRVTPLGTFLIFANKVDATKFKVNGTFEDMAQQDNIVAILHKDKAAPARIEIISSDAKKLVLETSTLRNKKNTKK